MEVHNDRELQHLQEQVRRAAHLTRTRLETLNLDSMGALYTLKFEECGYHPVSGHQLNLIEQLNQTFTVMASLAAARFLFEWFPEPELGGLRFHLATQPGRDIESINPNVVEAEVFTAVRPNNNRKLRTEIRSLSQSPAVNRYVFFYAPKYDSGRQYNLERPEAEVQVWALGRQDIM